MPDTTPKLSMPVLMPSQAQKHVTHNEALMVLDALCQLAVQSLDSDTPPLAPDAGDAWIVALGGSGDWVGQEGKIAVFDGAGWQFFQPSSGYAAWVISENRFVVFDGTDWITAPITQIQNAARIGLGTVGDAANPFAARLNNALWTAVAAADGGNGDIQQTLNRESSSDNAGFVLQSNYSTRAVMGLFGNDNLRLSVSSDGSNFKDGLIVDGLSGAMSQPNLPRFIGTTNFDNLFVEDTWATVAINDLSYNDQACFDAATHQFTAPSAGTYFFGANVLFKSLGEPVRSRVRLLKNGVDEIPGSYLENSGAHINLATATPTSVMTVLAAGDTVELQYRTRGGDSNCAADQTAFWGHKIG